MLNSILTNPVTLPGLLICLAVSMVLGVLTALVFLYRSRHSASFALTLALLPMTVAIIIMLVNGNIGTGVAVAGAFALVRFRSVPGTAREIAAIFTAMALGLALGMGYIGIAVVFFVLSAVFTLLLTMVDFGAASLYEKHLKITIPENFDYEGLFDDVFEKYASKVQMTKIRTTNMGTLFELSYGCMWFGYLRNTLSNATIKSATLTLHRKTGSGSGSAKTVFLCAVTNASASGSPSIVANFGAIGTIGRNAQVTFAIPIAAVQGLANGTYGGLCLYEAPYNFGSSTYSDCYMRMSGADTNLKPYLTVVYNDPTAFG